MINEKRPRQYAHEYMTAKTKEEKWSIYNDIPENLRSMVQLHVEISRDRERMRK